MFNISADRSNDVDLCRVNKTINLFKEVHNVAVYSESRKYKGKFAINLPIFCCTRLRIDLPKKRSVTSTLGTKKVTNTGRKSDVMFNAILGTNRLTDKNDYVLCIYFIY